MEKWTFCDDNDNLIKLVLDGKKTATTSNYDKNDLPSIGKKVLFYIIMVSQLALLKLWTIKF